MPTSSIKHGYSPLPRRHVASNLLDLFVVTTHRIAPVLRNEPAFHSVSAALRGATDKSLTHRQNR